MYPGPFLAARHFGVDPDRVILAKALSGGLIPVGAVLMSDAVCESVYSTLPGAFVHTSTFSKNSLAMQAGRVTLEVPASEKLGQRATDSGMYLHQQLTETLREFEMVKEIRGLGKPLRLRIPYEAFSAIHAGMFGQIVVTRLFRDWGFLTQLAEIASWC
jgi:ornithine--oxo-acid transaminase